jgi:lipopolysaccharide transport system ATP-binding protein
VSDPIISIENLGKCYRLRHEAKVPYQTLREALATKARQLVGRRKDRPDRATEEEFWALRDVNLEIARGDVVGVIGRNGAGKSTLLKLLSRITEPTTGRIRLRGRVASLLEVGTGFHPELTGRENIFLNGAILGMTKSEIRDRFDEIVEFAEVARFLDTPVKHYSSGMYVRLAFAVAAHLEPDVLLVDEVLAVGDTEFQNKCLGKMRAVAHQGRTVMLVSHTMHAVTALCNKGILLSKGSTTFYGDANECVSNYLKTTSHEEKAWVRPGEMPSSPLQVEAVSISLAGSQPSHSLEVSIGVRSTAAHQPAFLAIDIRDATGVTLMQALPRPQGFIDFNEAPRAVDVSISLPPLIPGRYYVGIWIGPHHSDTLDYIPECGSFEVTQSPSTGRTYPNYSAHGYIVPESTAAINANSLPHL